uniref:HTH_Tnp_Tc3_1 domain-containing protein n=1 Tax=Heterorhabditis bacteriophora TaxID=37862 RepID=A0A1I7W9A2_HETBA
MSFVDQCRKLKIAHGSLLNYIEKREILGFSDAELNRTEIAREIGRSRKVFANFLRTPGGYGIKKSGEHLLPDCVENKGLDGTESKSIHQVILPFFHVYVPFRYKLQSIQKVFSTRNFGG